MNIDLEGFLIAVSECRSKYVSGLRLRLPDIGNFDSDIITRSGTLVVPPVLIWGIPPAPLSY